MPFPCFHQRQGRDIALAALPSSIVRELAEVCREAWHGGMLAGCNGNASCRWQSPEGERIVITRSGAAKGRLTLRDLCLREDAGTAADSLKVAVPAHGVKVYRLTGKRSLPVRYEAEWAYIPDFTTIGANECARVLETDSASAGAVVAGLGGSEGNCLVWDDVYVPEAGEYILDIDYSCAGNFGFELGVNGRTQPVTVGPPVGTFGSCKVVAELEKGCNVVTIGSADGPVPVMDGFSLIKK